MQALLLARTVPSLCACSRSRPRSPALGPRCSTLGRMMPAQAAPSPAGISPVLLFDIMDTVVYDPFFHDMPKFFGLTFKELLATKHPSAWVEFENGEITEDQLLAKFFADGRAVDGQALKGMMHEKYRYLDGMEPLLSRLKASGYELHAMSNYPQWYRLIEDKLAPSRYLEWTFVSCEGPMKGHRKPCAQAYAACIEALGRPAAELVFIDDRQVNIDGALAAGIDGILFKGAAELEQQLLQRGLRF